MATPDQYRPFRFSEELHATMQKLKTATEEEKPALIRQAIAQGKVLMGGPQPEKRS